MRTAIESALKWVIPTLDVPLRTSLLTFVSHRLRGHAASALRVIPPRHSSSPLALGTGSSSRRPSRARSERKRRTVLRSEEPPQPCAGGRCSRRDHRSGDRGAARTRQRPRPAPSAIVRGARGAVASGFEAKSTNFISPITGFVVGTTPACPNQSRVALARTTAWVRTPAGPSRMPSARRSRSPSGGSL